MQVKATRVGYYGEKRRLEGEVFSLAKKEEFSESWMKKTKEDAHASNQRFHPARVQNAPDARDVNQVIDDTLGDESVAANGGVSRSQAAAGFTDVDAESGKASKGKKKSSSDDVI